MPIVWRFKFLEWRRKKIISIYEDEKGAEEWKVSEKNSKEIGIGAFCVVRLLGAIGLFVKIVEERRSSTNIR
jgi:hypothetical protein